MNINIFLENWAHTSGENVEDWKFWFVNLYIDFHWISCFHDRHSYFMSYTSLSIILQKVNVENVWQKLIQCLFKLKRIDQIILGKKGSLLI